MNRIAWLLSALGAILVVGLFFVFLYQPAREEASDLESQIENELSLQAGVRAEIDRLQDTRERAAEAEADIATAEQLVPQEAGTPALLRQLQLAADDAGMQLTTVTVGRPTELSDTGIDGLSQVPIGVVMRGTYFQLIDFLRRIEDPSITARGLTWGNAAISRADDDYPDLAVNLTGSAYAVVAVPEEPEAPEPPPTEETDDTVEDLESDDTNEDGEDA
jgi:Tfp pilus assembly protein PilO